jgi:type II secretory pathway pseudopilin PulG
MAARERAKRDLVAKRLRYIALAIHTYKDGNGRPLPSPPGWPTNICDPQGKPLLSWQVRIATQLLQDTSLDGLHLDEPWDSEHNRQFIERMPEAFASHELPNDGRTTFLAPLGPGTLLGDPSISARPERDSSSDRILVVEADADRAIPWTCPDDLPFDRRNPISGLGNQRQGAFYAAFADTAVRLVPLSTGPRQLRSMMEGHDLSQLPP